MAQQSTSPVNAATTGSRRELYAFLGITFTATYGLQLAVYALAGPLSYASSAWSAALSGSMFIPAVAAGFCMVLFRSRALTRETSIIFLFFLVHAVLFIVETSHRPLLGTIHGKPLVSSGVAAAGILALLIMHARKKWRSGLEPSRLSVGAYRLWYLTVPLIFSMLLIITSVLFNILGLGKPAESFSIASFFSKWLPDIMIFGLILWPSYFGEEYGWRAYLQDRLFPITGVPKGVILLGIIWGLWHGVIVTLGHNYPGYPLLGNVFMTVYCIVLGAIFSYAVLKTGSVWISVLLHLINNKTAPVASSYLGNSDNLLLGSALGIMLLMIFALILAWISRGTPAEQPSDGGNPG
jgi:membrane protease YdiL (CAAX protease family)